MKENEHHKSITIITVWHYPIWLAVFYTDRNSNRKTGESGMRYLLTSRYTSRRMLSLL